MVDTTKVLVSWELMDNITQQAHLRGSTSIYMHTFVVVMTIDILLRLSGVI
jgi:hypothetical protein